jgi:copper chaperone CopZ
MSTETYDVTGMTCEHCTRAISAEIAAVAGVTAVDVDVTTGTITVGSSQPVNIAEIRDAVEEAGYSLGS